MPSSEVAVAKIQARRDAIVAATRAAQNILANPVVELVGAFVLVEYLQKHPADQPLLGTISGTAIEVAVPSAVIIQQLSAALGVLGGANPETLKSIAALAPLLLK